MSIDATSSLQTSHFRLILLLNSWENKKIVQRKNIVFEMETKL